MTITHIVSALPSANSHRPSVALAGRMLPPGDIHMGLAQGIAPALRDFGIDPAPLIRMAGLRPSLMDDAAGTIPLSVLGRLLTLGVARTNCPHFGLLVGKHASPLSLGMIGRLMLHSETIGDALRAFVSALWVQGRGVAPSLSIENDVVLFSCSVSPSYIESADQIADGSIALAMNVLRSLCGRNWSPVEVLLPRSRPADLAPYCCHFRAPVRFNQEIAAIVLAARDLTLPIAGADPVMKAVLEEKVVRIPNGHGTVFAADIRRLLRARLTRNRCSAEEIAELLAIHRRTLSRRLKGDGAGYRAIVNEVRFEIARQMLKDTDLPLTQIAAALGYSEASAFTRAFRRWSGQVPTAWRAGALKAAAQASKHIGVGRNHMGGET